MLARAFIVIGVLGLLACTEAAAPYNSRGSFTFTISMPGQPIQLVNGDSTYWEFITPPILPVSAWNAFITSPDSISGSPPPTNFYLSQGNPVFRSGSLAAGSYDLTAGDSTAAGFSLSYPDLIHGAHGAVSDSGVLTVMPPTGDSVVRGSVSARMYDLLPGVGPHFHVTGHFTIVPRHD